MRITTIALAVSLTTLAGCAGSTSTPAAPEPTFVQQSTSTARPSSSVAATSTTSLAERAPAVMTVDTEADFAPDEAAHPEDIAGLFVSALMSRDLDFAYDLSSPSLSIDDLAAWTASLSIDNNAWVIEPRLIDAASGRATVIVSVATPQAEPIGYLVNLIDDDGWIVTTIQYA